MPDDRGGGNLGHAQHQLIFSRDLIGCRFVLLDLSFISVYFQGFIEVGANSHV
jgi:hypothetical protein